MHGSIKALRLTADKLSLNDVAKLITAINNFCNSRIVLCFYKLSHSAPCRGFEQGLVFRHHLLLA